VYLPITQATGDQIPSSALLFIGFYRNKNVSFLSHDNQKIAYFVIRKSMAVYYFVFIYIGSHFEMYQPHVFVDDPNKVKYWATT